MKADTLRVCFRFWLWIVILTMLLLCYVTDERCSLGEAAERVRWTKQRGEFCSAVENFKGACHLQKFSVTASGQANAKRLRE